jgi:hypothetical protein
MQNRDFEFRQLMRAYRSGLIGEATFEEEMAALEQSAGRGNGAGERPFEAFGRRYRSERAAIVSFIDKVRAGEKNGGEAFAAWAEVCATDCLRSGIRMIAERESYHSRIFERRLADLGGECRAGTTDEGRKLCEVLGHPKTPDKDKLLYFTKRVGEPEEAVKPIRDFAALIREDVETKEALRLFADDELSSTRWVRDACRALAG